MLISDGQERGPALPRYVPGTARERWHPATVRWWNHWRMSPQAMRMATEVDWDFLFETAMLHHRFWMGELSLGTELRLRQAKFGVTPEDRARLGIDVGTDVPRPVAEQNQDDAVVTELRARAARIIAQDGGS